MQATRAFTTQASSYFQLFFFYIPSLANLKKVNKSEGELSYYDRP